MRRAIAAAATLMVSVTMLYALPAHAATGTGSVLIYGPSMFVSDGYENEQSIAAANGYTVTVADTETWAAMSTSQFASFDAIIFGDPDCGEDPSILQTAVDNRSTWSAAVTGNKVVIGTDPTFHLNVGTQAARTVIANGIEFSTSASGTGLYVALSCYYAASPADTPVPLLAGIGSFSVEGQNADNAHILQPGHPTMAGLDDTALSTWGNSIHEVLDSFPGTFQAIAENGDTLVPYIVATSGGGGEGVPGAPRNVAADPGDASAAVSWAAPTSNGGSPITSYTVTSNPDGIQTTVDGSTLATTIGGLQNGVSYTFTVFATNINGDGPPSAPSNAVTPAANAEAAVCDSGGCSVEVTGTNNSGEVQVPPGGPDNIVVALVDTSNMDTPPTCRLAICLDVKVRPGHAFRANNPIRIVLILPSIPGQPAQTRPVYKNRRLLPNCTSPGLLNPKPACVDVRTSFMDGGQSFDRFEILATSADPKYRVR